MDRIDSTSSSDSFSSFNHLHLRQGGANFPIFMGDHLVPWLEPYTLSLCSENHHMQVCFADAANSISPVVFCWATSCQMYFSENAEPLQLTRGKNDWWVDLQNILVRHQILTDLCSLNSSVWLFTHLLFPTLSKSPSSSSPTSVPWACEGNGTGGVSVYQWWGENHGKVWNNCEQKPCT